MPPIGADIKFIRCPCDIRTRFDRVFSAMNKSEQFDNLIDPLVRYLGNHEMLVELAALAGIAIAAWLGLRRLRQRLSGTTAGTTVSLPRLESLAFAGKHAAPGVDRPLADRTLAERASVQSGGALLLSFLAIQSCFFILRRVLQADPHAARRRTSGVLADLGGVCAASGRVSGRGDPCAGQHRFQSANNICRSIPC
jgi:hypothetical protein